MDEAMTPVAAQVVLDQREANEQLVLATIRAHEQAEQAESARASAETGQ